MFFLEGAKLANETVEKLYFQTEREADSWSSCTLNGTKRGRAGLDQRPKGVDFADIVHQSGQPPLYFHFQFGAQREAVHALLHTDIDAVNR
jgi:hypothetical protein